MVSGRSVFGLSVFLMVLVIFTGVVSAAEWDVNPGDSIQSVVDGAADNDTITVRDDAGIPSTYVENVIIRNKTVNLKTEGNVTIQALDENQPIFYLNHTDGTTITGFQVQETNNRAIYLYNSSYVVISENSISNAYTGIFINYGHDNIISNNNLTNNNYGVETCWSANNSFIGNNIINNTGSGLYLCDNGLTYINFNRIAQNQYYGLYVESGTFNATNNWWGSNNPSVIYGYCDILVDGGTVYYDPWIVLNVTNDFIDGDSSTITADLTHNSDGVGTSSDGNLPDNIPIDFFTDLGIVTNMGYTSNGRAEAIFNRGSITSGMATVTATLDNQNATTNITINGVSDTVAPVVTVNPLGGNYTCYLNVTLNATDNLDPNPVIYYTLDGSTPMLSSMVYSAPLLIMNSTVLKFMACDSAGNQAVVQTINYVLNLPVLNVRTNKGYATIQEAVDSASVGDIIEVYNGTYVENIVLNKNIVLRSAEGNTVILRHSNMHSPVIYVSNVDGAVISGFNIQGIYDDEGIFLYNSVNTLISENNILDALDGIYIEHGHNNTISNNNLTNNFNGICTWASANNTFIKNNIINNDGSGLYLCDDGLDHVNFNRIVQNGDHGLYVESGDVNATNNWWGSNNISGDLNNITATPWLILDVGVTRENSTGDVILTADLIHNSAGEDTSPWGHVPDGVPVFFVTNIGNITSPIYIRNGKATTIWEGNNNTQVTATIDNQSIQSYININQVIVNYPSGSYNVSSLNVTLQTVNNLDYLFYTFNNGTTWYNSTGNVTWSLYEDIWNILYYSGDSQGHNSSIQNVSYVIDGTAPYVWTNRGTGLYNQPVMVNITASDNLDTNPLIYYTLDGSNPTNSSTIYTGSLNITNTTTLKFIAIDNLGNMGSIVTEYYIFSPIGNLNTGIGYDSIQIAIIDPLTLDGHVIEVANGTYVENVVVNKKVNLISDGDVTVQAANTSRPVFTIIQSGSGSLIQGFVIAGAVNSYGLCLDGSSNCTINNNTITNNYFGILTNTIKTENNTIINNNVNLNQEVGLVIWNADNYVIQGNTITYNQYGGITIFDSNHTIIHTNLIMSNYSPGNYDSSGILISNSNNTLIENNLIPMNRYGLYIDYCDNCTVYGNLIAQGIWGVYTDYSSVDINFNRIASNTYYELISENGTVNATNNWWGSNTNPVNLGEIVFSGYVDYNPWLVLSIDNSSTINSGGNTSIIADLTHNNLGEDTSSQGHVIKGLPITFGTNYGTISNQALTFNGQAAAILNLGTTGSRTVTVNASLDSQTVFKQMVIAPGVATLNITSTALNSSTLQPIILTYNLPLNNSVSWLSVLWKNTYVFYGELQIIVNGTIVKRVGYVNPAYNTWKNSYRSDVFLAIRYANNYILQDGMNTSTIPVSFWNDLKSLYNLTNTELVFVQNHRLEFIDNLTVKLTYPGVKSPTMTVTDPQSNSTINLNFTGNVVNRSSQIFYMDGSLGTAGYEGVKSFAIATSKVNNDILGYWLNQNSTYPVGSMKAAYGTFLTALIMEYAHDQVADAIANECNVTWSRTHPIAVSVGDDAYQTYLTLECDHSMGMTVVGSLKNTIMFNYICSSAISPLEYAVMDNLGESQFSTTNSSVNSVLLDLIGDYLFNNNSFEGFIQNEYLIIKTNSSNDNLLVIDPETGIVRDINTIYNYYGAYCFHDQLTSDICNLCNDLYWGLTHLNMNKVYTVGCMGSDVIQLILATRGIVGGVQLVITGAFTSEVGVGIVLVAGGIIVADASFYGAMSSADNLYKDWNIYNKQSWFN